MAITTKFWTLGQLRTKLGRDLDLEAEVFIRPDELTELINEAIDEAEMEIHGLSEDYFLTREIINLVAGQEEYDLPGTIYADKIRGIMYNNGSSVYEVLREREWHKFKEYEISKNYESANLYRYFLLNSTPGQPKIVLFPKAEENGAYLTIWFLRQANRLEAESDVMDMKEAHNFVLQHVKCRVYEKEGNPQLANAKADLEKERNLMVATMQNRVPDNNNTIELDLEFYKSFVG